MSVGRALALKSPKSRVGGDALGLVGKEGGLKMVMDVLLGGGVVGWGVDGMDMYVAMCVGG